MLNVLSVYPARTTLEKHSRKNTQNVVQANRRPAYCASSGSVSLLVDQQVLKLTPTVFAERYLQAPPNR